MKKNYVIKESSLNYLIENLINEQYDPEKLYYRDRIISQLERGPYELKRYIKSLPVIVRKDDDGNTIVLTKVPEVICVYLTGRY